MRIAKRNSREIAIDRPSFLVDLNLLFKSRLSITVVFSSVMAYAITASTFSWAVALLLAIGGFLTTGAANALNQVLEREYDALMDRTRNRPVASNRMSISTAVLIAGVSALFGTLLLSLAHPLAGFLGMLSLVMYAFIYTPLKRFGAFAVFVGAIPGALPVLIGAIIGSGGLTTLGFVLFGIQFFWQIPHFWSIAWLGHEDYSRAGFKLLPNSDNELKASIGIHAAVQALFILPLLVIGVLFGSLSLWAGIVVAGITTWYAWKGYALFKQTERTVARKLMFASFAYLPLVLLVILINSLII